MIESTEIPNGSMLGEFARLGHFADCYLTEVSREISLEAFVRAFYSTRLFSVERWILKVVARRPSTTEDIEALAKGHTRQFAAWDVEARAENELLLCDMTGKTRSWLMVRPVNDASATQLFFGSAVLGAASGNSGAPVLSPLIRITLPFHHWYSKALFGAARRALVR
ncbi:MAG: hypothetical protein AAGL69_07455 [Pseudomonadota bacterium]